jgi:hypothetical protein
VRFSCCGWAKPKEQKKSKHAAAAQKDKQAAGLLDSRALARALMCLTSSTTLALADDNNAIDGGNRNFFLLAVRPRISILSTLVAEHKPRWTRGAELDA